MEKKILEIINLYKAPEIHHIITPEDRVILNKYDEDLDGGEYDEEWVPEEMVGKTLEQASERYKSEGFKDENLQHMIAALYPNKYEYGYHEYEDDDPNLL